MVEFSFADPTSPRVTHILVAYRPMVDITSYQSENTKTYLQLAQENAGKCQSPHPPAPVKKYLHPPDLVSDRSRDPRRVPSDTLPGRPNTTPDAPPPKSPSTSMSPSLPQPSGPPLPPPLPRDLFSPSPSPSPTRSRQPSIVPDANQSSEVGEISQLDIAAGAGSIISFPLSSPSPMKSALPIFTQPSTDGRD